MGWFSRSSENQDLSDEQAVARYRYMLRTAPPEAIEKAHEEAFASFTPEQRRMALQELAANAPQSERNLATDDPRSLARLATRSEIRQPGVLERLFGNTRNYGGGFGMGGSMGGLFAGSLLSSLAGSFIGSAIAQNFFADHPYDDNLGAAVSGGEDYDESDTLHDVQSEEDSSEFTDGSFGDFDGGDSGDLV